MRRRWLGISVGVLALSLLTGCTAHDAVGAPPTASPSTSLATARPALADLVLSPSGLGPLRVGSPVPTSPEAAALVSWSPRACVSTDFGITADDPRAGDWESTYPEIPQQDRNVAPFIVVTADGGRASTISAIRVWGGAIHTAKGIHVGSTRAELRAAYSSFSKTVSDGISDAYVLTGPTGSLTIEVAKQYSDGGTNFWPDDQVDTVLWMSTTVAGIDPGPIAGTDVGPSACPNGS